jgi:hypothetical protein
VGVSESRGVYYRHQLCNEAHVYATQYIPFDEDCAFTFLAVLHGRSVFRFSTRLSTPCVHLRSSHHSCCHSYPTVSATESPCPVTIAITTSWSSAEASPDSPPPSTSRANTLRYRSLWSRRAPGSEDGCVVSAYRCPIVKGIGRACCSKQVHERSDPMPYPC